MLTDFKRDFPFTDKNIIYFDNAATTQRPRQVIESISEFYKYHNANIHRGVHALSVDASEMYEEARKKIARFVGAEADEIVFVRNTTEALNFVAQAYALEHISKEENIVISEMEHHSNILPWQRVSKKTKANLRYIPISDEGILLNPERVVDKNTKIVSITHASNVLGTVNDVEYVCKLAHENDATCVIDGAQSVPHMPVNVKKMGCDFMAFSGHKMLGPFGIGVLYVNKHIVEEVEPLMVGGGMIAHVEKFSAGFTRPPERFEAGTPNVAGAIGLGAAVEYLTKIGMDEVYKHETKLTEKILSGLRNMSGVTVYGHSSKSVGVISFNIKGKNFHDVGLYLSDRGIYVRTGHHCAQPLMERLNIRGTVRASLYIYNSEEEVDRFLMEIKHLTEG